MIALMLLLLFLFSLSHLSRVFSVLNIEEQNTNMPCTQTHKNTQRRGIPLHSWAVILCFRMVHLMWWILCVKKVAIMENNEKIECVTKEQQWCAFSWIGDQRKVPSFSFCALGKILKSTNKTNSHPPTRTALAFNILFQSYSLFILSHASLHIIHFITNAS